MIKPPFAKDKPVKVLRKKRQGSQKRPRHYSVKDLFRDLEKVLGKGLAGLMVLTWTYKWFLTATGAAAFLQTLPEDRQWESKLSCDQAGCYVFYRIEHEQAVR